jgi:hypothetical protein
MSSPEFLKKVNWLDHENIRPYVLAREVNLPTNPGQLHSHVDWFDLNRMVYKDPFHLKELEFSDLILDIEGRAFQGANMAMPRWVFYDCAIMPGIVCGFAQRTSTLSPAVKTAIGRHIEGEWTPLSLFICIPTVQHNAWLAHNLSSINSLLLREDRYYGLGFLSKAFGLWYCNVPNLFGMTQWESPAMKLHCNYGNLEILTAFTPVHSHPRTVTYNCDVDDKLWDSFFTKKFDSSFHKDFEYSGFDINPKDRKSMLSLQARLEAKENKYYLDPEHLRNEPLGEPIPIYLPR